MIYSFSSEQALASGFSGFRSDVEQSNPLYQVQNADSADITTVRRLATEMIQINGANVRIHPRTNNDDHNKVWDEDADPTYKTPVNCKGFFVPQPLEYELTQWGVDTTNKAEIVFSLDEMVSLFGNRLLRTGDLIELPFNSQMKEKPKYYLVDNAQEFGNFRYTWLYLKCQTTLMPGEVNLKPAQDHTMVDQNYPDGVE